MWCSDELSSRHNDTVSSPSFRCGGMMTISMIPHIDEPEAIWWSPGRSKLLSEGKRDPGGGGLLWVVTWKKSGTGSNMELNLRVLLKCIAPICWRNKRLSFVRDAPGTRASWSAFELSTSPQKLLQVNHQFGWCPNYALCSLHASHFWDDCIYFIGENVWTAWNDMDVQRETENGTRGKRRTKAYISCTLALTRAQRFLYLLSRGIQLFFIWC